MLSNTLATGIFWFWNATPTPAGIRRQLRDISDAGFNCVYIHPMPDSFHPWNFFVGMKCSYLGKKYFELLAVALEECKKLGLTMMLYDEGGWPSGGVLDRLIARYPECRGKFLVRDEHGNVSAIDADFPDLLSCRSTERFIELTHELYYRHFGREFGKTIKGIFTDEPFFSMVNDADRVFYSPQMDELAKKMFNCSFEKDLLPLLWKGTGNLPGAAAARRKYMEIASKLFADNYIAVLGKWCKKHRIALAGHVNHEDEYFINADCGDLPEIFSGMEIPGVDAIWRQIYPGNSPGYYARFASGAAIANGRERALCECFNVYGYGLIPREMDWVANALVMQGINHLLVMPYIYSDTGKHKICCSTDFSPRNPVWMAMKELNRRWQFAADFDLSKMESCVHVLARNEFSIPDNLWGDRSLRNQANKEMETLLNTLDRHGVNWRFTSIAEMQKNPARPEVLIVTSALDEWEQQIIDQAVSAGMTVVDSWCELLENFACVAVKTPDSGCLVRTAVRPEGEALMIFNPALESVKFAFDSPEKWGEITADPAIPALFPLEHKQNSYRLTIPAGVLRIFIKNRPALPEESWQARPLELSWELAKVERLCMSADKPTCWKCENADPALWQNGLWKATDFSGIITLTAEVELPEAETRAIRFEQICHAGILSINGKYCGTQVAAPWTFKAELQPGRNRLELKIASSAGNEWRRCVRDELEPRKWVNCYLPRIRSYTLTDTDTGIVSKQN
ncbi:MAG: hypothetical protein E7057_07325 [Lentisphaerae bacterium]|nr:hypothetical protein [Lentisphaerota bacterium]